ncbi:MAG: metallophosphoesterase [Oligoflexales bacterium]
MYRWYLLLLVAFAVSTCGFVDKVLNRPSWSGSNQSVFQTYATRICVVEFANGSQQNLACDRLELFIDAESTACQRYSSKPVRAHFPDQLRTMNLCRASSGKDYSQANSIRFLVFGDVGSGQEASYGHQQLRVSQAMQSVCFSDNKEGCDFALITGDLIYPNGVDDVWSKDFNTRFESMYREFKTPFRFFVVPGNHDYKGNAKAQVEYSLFSNLWSMPDTHYAIKNLPDWLSIYAADSTLIKESSSSYSQQLREAAAALCSKQGWRVIFAHHPPMSNGNHGGDPTMLRFVSDLSAQCDIHFVFGGHDHHQEHIQTDSFDVIVQGAGGYKTRDVHNVHGLSLTASTPGKSYNYRQLFAKKAHGFAAVKMDSEKVDIWFYDIQKWPYGLLSYKTPPSQNDSIYHCRSTLESPRCQSL